MHKAKDTPRGEPSYGDLLTGPFPVMKPMPEDRPYKVEYYVTREEEHHQEVDRLKNAVVMTWVGDDLSFEPDTVASYTARTGLVSKEEIMVAILGKGRYLIHLPAGLSPDTFIKATPPDLWDYGLSFASWTPWLDAELKVPHFRILANLVGFPIELWKEEEVIKAVSSFGTYLGSVKPDNPMDFSQ